MSRLYKVFSFKAATGVFASQDIHNAGASIKPRGTMVAYGPHLYDAILYVVTCKTHEKMLLKELRRGIYYMPFFPLKIGKCNFPGGSATCVLISLFG